MEEGMVKNATNDIEMSALCKREDENQYQFIWRVASAKDNGLIDKSWEDLAKVFNRELGIPDKMEQTESSFRKPYQAASIYYENVFAPMIRESGASGIVEDMQREKEEIYEATTQLRDQRRSYYSSMRLAGRVEARMNAFDEALSAIGTSRYTRMQSGVNSVRKSGKDLLVLLSDMHIGIRYDNASGSYDLAIAKKRLAEYRDKCIELGKMYDAENVYITVLGDNISGNIHRTLDVENEETVVRQMTICSEMVADFVVDFAKEFSHVYLNSVSGNHSRLLPKDMASLSERLDDVIIWYVNGVTQHLDNVTVCVENKNGNTVACHEIRGKKYYSVHGDLDSMSQQGIANLMLWLGEKPYAVLKGHRHSPAMMRVADIVVVQGGSLGGSGDEYTIQKRLTGDACQTVCVCDESGIINTAVVTFKD